MQNQVTLKTANHLFPCRVHFPAGPAFFKAEQADEAALVEIVMMALAVPLVPFHPGELGLGNGCRAEPKMDWEVVKRFALITPRP